MLIKTTRGFFSVDRYIYRSMEGVRKTAIAFLIRRAPTIIALDLRFVSITITIRFQVTAATNVLVGAITTITCRISITTCVVTTYFISRFTITVIYITTATILATIGWRFLFLRKTSTNTMIKTINIAEPIAIFLYNLLKLSFI